MADPRLLIRAFTTFSWLVVICTSMHDRRKQPMVSAEVARMQLYKQFVHVQTRARTFVNAYIYTYIYLAGTYLPRIYVYRMCNRTR